MFAGGRGLQVFGTRERGVKIPAPLPVSEVSLQQRRAARSCMCAARRVTRTAHGDCLHRSGVSYCAAWGMHAAVTILLGAPVEKNWLNLTGILVKRLVSVGHIDRTLENGF